MALSAAPVSKISPEEPPVAAAGRDFGFLLETIVSDLSRSLMEAATLAIASNVCARHEVGWTLRMWRHLLVDDSAGMRLALRYASEVGFSTDDARAIGAFYDELACEKRALAPLMSAVDVYSGKERPALAEAAARLTRLAARAGEMLSVVESIVEQRLATPYADDLRLLAQLLREAASGGGPHVDSRSPVDLPPLAQRRRAPRASAHAPCLLDIGGALAAAVIENVSRCGLGLRSGRPAPVDARIVVVLADGRRLNAVVRHRNGERFGVALAVPLAYDDPLFASLAPAHPASAVAAERAIV